MNLTKDKYFIDTNILIYSFIPEEMNKYKVANYLIKNALKTHRGIIGTQVIQEFLNVIFKKFEEQMTATEAEKYLNKVLIPICDYFPSFKLYSKAIELKDKYGYAFYDTLIITAAIQSGCKVLYSEDLQDGQSVEGLKIVNPFSEQ